MPRTEEGQLSLTDWGPLDTSPGPAFIFSSQNPGSGCEETDGKGGVPLIRRSPALALAESRYDLHTPGRPTSSASTWLSVQVCQSQGRAGQPVPGMLSYPGQY